MSGHNHSSLAPQHLQRLARSGVSQEVMNARRYETVDTRAGIERLGFSRTQANPPALVIPQYDAAGQQVGVQIRPDKPRLNGEGKPLKYESPRNSRVVIDVPPAVRAKVLDPLQPLVITEGAIKADAAASNAVPCVSIAGVFSWKADDGFWTTVPLHDRTVFVAFDSDQATNPNVRIAALRLHNELRRHGAKAKVLCLPPAPDGAKQGLDDFLAGHSAQELYGLPLLDVDTVDEPAPPVGEGQYRMTPSGLVREVVKDDEVVQVPLTNFNARIVANNQIDSGSDVRHELEIAVDLKGDRRLLSVPAEEFEGMSWVLARLGGNAMLHAGIHVRDHARAAIQAVSGAIPHRKLYSGPRKLDHESNSLGGGCFLW